MSAYGKAVIVKLINCNDVTAEPDVLAEKRKPRRQHIIIKAAGAEAAHLYGAI